MCIVGESVQPAATTSAQLTQPMGILDSGEVITVTATQESQQETTNSSLPTDVMISKLPNIILITVIPAVILISAVTLLLPMVIMLIQREVRHRGEKTINICKVPNTPSGDELHQM